MAAAATGVGGGDLMSSIAAVRQLLMREFPGSANSDVSRLQHSLADELSVVQQSRYEDRMTMEEERKAHMEMVEDFRLRLEEAKRERHQELALRRSLEETNEALQNHTEELSAQLEAISSASNRSALSLDREDSTAMENRVKALELENEDSKTTLLASQKTLEEVRQTSEGWKSQCLASQRQVQELQIQLDSFKKEYQTSQFRHEEIIQGKNTRNESFQKRLEESVAARKQVEGELQAILTSGNQKSPLSIGDTCGIPIVDLDSSAGWTRMYEAAESLRIKAQEKIDQLEAELETMKRDKSKEDVERGREGREQIWTKISSMQTSFDMMKDQANALQNEVEELEQGSASSKANTDELNGKQEAVSLGVVPVASLEAVLEPLEGNLKEKLARAKATMDNCSSEFKRVREELHLAKEAVMQVQAEISEYQKKLKELTNSKKEEQPPSAARIETPETASVVGRKESTKSPTRKKDAPANKGTSGSDQNKRKSTDGDGAATANKRKKT